MASGIVNISEYARRILGTQPLLAIGGGLHLFAASETTLQWTGAKLKSYPLLNLLACTGLKRKSAVVSSVGSSVTLGEGIDPRALAQ